MTAIDNHPATLRLGSGLERLSRRPISTVPFVSAAFFERERAIWKDSWLMLGRETDISEPGEYLTFDLKVLNTSICVIRTRDHTLNAFHNIWPHRGGRLLWDACGKSASIVCRYHGWSFGLDGSFRDAPEPQLFDDLDDGSHNLLTVAVDTWGGFVFVNLHPQPRHSLQHYLAALPPKLNNYLADPRWQWYTGYQRAFHANWKDLMNIQHEGYHASHIHKQTLGAYFSPKECRNTVFPDSPGVCSLLNVLRPLLSEDLLARMSTVQKLSMKYGTTSNWVDQDTSRATHEIAGAVNHMASERWVFDCYTLYPNLLLFVGTDVLSVMRVWPLSAHEADWEWDWYFKDELRNFGNLFNREHGRLATRNALTEDWPVCESAHRNLRSGLLKETPIGADMEATVRALYDKVLAHLGLDESELADVDD